MRAAPPVSVRCTGGRAWRWARALLPALAAAAIAAWLQGHAGQPPSLALPAAAIAGLLGWWRAAPRAILLAWDGQRWTADQVAGELDVMIDLGGWLLLRLRAAEVRWIALAAAEAGPAWHGLRCAVFSALPAASE